MSGDYQVIYDIRVQAYQVAPLLIVVAMPILIPIAIFIGKLRRGFVPGKLKLMLWGSYILYAMIVAGSYWDLWQKQSAPQHPGDIKVVEGPLSDGWARTKSGSKTTDLYQHFKVKGVEFLHRNRRRGFSDFMIPRAQIPTFPLVEGARVRVTYRGEGEERTILKFEIAPADLSSN